MCSCLYRRVTSDTYRLRKDNEVLKKDNEKSRKTLEASLKEYTIVTKALQILGYGEDEDMFDNIDDSDLSDPKVVNEKKLKHETKAKSIQPEHRHVRFSSKNQEATIRPEDDQKGEKEKGRFSKQKARDNP